MKFDICEVYHKIGGNRAHQTHTHIRTLISPYGHIVKTHGSTHKNAQFNDKVHTQALTCTHTHLVA